MGIHDRLRLFQAKASLIIHVPFICLYCQYASQEHIVAAQGQYLLHLTLYAYRTFPDNGSLHKFCSLLCQPQLLKFIHVSSALYPAIIRGKA